MSTEPDFYPPSASDSDGDQTGERDVPWTLGDVVLSVVLGTVLGLLIAALTAAAMLGSRDRIDSAAFTIVALEIYGAVAFMAWLLVVRRRKVTAADLGFKNARAGALLLMIPLTIGVLIVNGFVSLVTSLLFGDVPDAGDQLAIGGEMSLTDLLSLMSVVVVVGPVVEELVFRGLLFPVLRARWGIGLGALVSALAFALTHFTLLLIGVLFVLGFVLAHVFHRYDSLYPPIAMHALNNAFAMLVLYSMQ